MIKTPPPAVNPLHPIGEWNTYEIRCDGPKITLWVNGDLTGEFTAPEVPKGYWGLEAEGYRIEFRNIKLKSFLKPGPDITSRWDALGVSLQGG